MPLYRQPFGRRKGLHLSMIIFTRLSRQQSPNSGLISNKQWQSTLACGMNSYKLNIANGTS